MASCAINDYGIIPDYSTKKNYELLMAPESQKLDINDFLIVFISI